METNLVEADNFKEKIPKVQEHTKDETSTLMSKSDNYLLQKGLLDEKGASTFHESQGKSSFPVIWASDDEKEDKQNQLKRKRKSIGIIKKSKLSKLKCIRGRQDIPRPYKLNPQLDFIDNRFFGGIHNGASVKNKCKGHSLVSGSSYVSWNETEVAVFTLGLYIFGKNFVLVKKFIGNKTMEDIQTFYYGEFYMSNFYLRWDRYMKIDGKKCNSHREVAGNRKCNGCREKTFTKPRKQEFLSRLQLYVPEKSHNKLFEMHKTFLGGKITLEDYFFALKAFVELKSLAKAFGIGNENGLNLIIEDSFKSTHEAQVRPMSQASKGYSRLTIAEILRLLTGDLRRSKTQSSALFWEAIWPRLLSKGWRFEKLGTSNNYTLPYKGPLRFIIPAVDKFPRKLVKGTHYFDSISDVLSQVASKPHLIELMTVASNDFPNDKGEKYAEEENLSLEYSSDHQSHYQIQPQNPDVSAEVFVFNIVDTSMGVEKVAELRNLPIGVIKDSAFENYSLPMINKEFVDVSYSSSTMDEPQLNIKMMEAKADENTIAERQSTDTSMGAEKVAELRNLPIGVIKVSAFENFSLPMINKEFVGVSYSTSTKDEPVLNIKMMEAEADENTMAGRQSTDTSMGAEKVAELMNLPIGVIKDSAFEKFSLPMINKEFVDVSYSTSTKDEPLLNIKMMEAEADENTMAERQSTDTSMGAEKVAKLRNLPIGVIKDSAFENFSLPMINKEFVDVSYSTSTKDEPQLNIKMMEAEADENTMVERQSTDTTMKFDDHHVDPTPTLNMNIMKKSTRPSQKTIEVLEDLASEMAKSKTKRKGLGYLLAKFKT